MNNMCIRQRINSYHHHHHRTFVGCSTAAYRETEPAAQDNDKLHKNIKIRYIKIQQWRMIVRACIHSMKYVVFSELLKTRKFALAEMTLEL